MSDDAIPAATVIVVREGGNGPELLIVERAGGMTFAGGALVFPGGRIDERDRRFARALSYADGAARIAAVRESVEETAIPVALKPLPSPQQAAHLQRELVGGADFGDLLNESGLALDLDTLVPLARWVPKFHASRRFDTLFLLAPAPSGKWPLRPQPGECAGAFWMTAAQVLEKDRVGEAKLIFPTRRTLERLAQHATFDAMAEDARAYAIEPITPWVEEHGDERFITIPEGIGYPVTREKLDGLWRG